MRESSILADSYSDLSSGGLDILYKTISLVFQSFFYGKQSSLLWNNINLNKPGIYALLIPFSINALLYANNCLIYLEVNDIFNAEKEA